MNNESVFQNESFDSSLENIMHNISSYGIINNSGMPPFNLPLMLRINRFLCIIFGIPLNGLVLVVIVRSRQLWSTRNIFWLTVTFFNLLALIQAVMELAMFYSHQHGDPDGFLICKIYSVTVGCPYALLLTTLTLASSDRYSAPAHPQFYQRYVTKKRVTWTLLIIVLTIIGGHLAPYWMGYLRADECQLHFDWLALTLTYNGLMALICLILQIRLYLFIRYCIDYSANADRSSNDNTANPTAVPVVATTAAVFLNSYSSGYCCEQHAQISNNSRPRSTFISCPSGQRLSWLEMRAAKILTVGILPFCFINLPSSLSGVAIHFVAKYLGNDYVGWLRILMVALRELILLHLIYIPAVFSTQSREFRFASRRCCRCCCRKRKRRRRRRFA